uniref:Putative membrane glycoprotein lig-1 n=1 Tax=Aedes albopictus TaxID=7160 RepID=A0A1W7R8N6_AEDAL
MSLLRSLLSLLVLTLQYSTAQKVYECENSSSDVCVLVGVEHTPNDEEPIILPEELQFVEMLNGNIPKIDEDFYNEFGEPPTNFTVTNCNVEQLFVSPQFVHLNATGNKLKTVTINGKMSYNRLKMLIVSRNQLRRLPNIKDLTQLEHLDVSRNIIDFIDLNVFQRLTNLKVLNLEGNRINSLDGPFRLGKLTELRLNSNELQEISFDSWNLTNLAIFDLSLNLLMYLNGDDLREPFPRLRYLGLPGNQWNCRALPKLLATLQERSVRFFGDVTRCGKNWTTVQGLCCQDSYVNWVTLHSQWEIRKLERRIQTLNDTLLADLAKVKDEQGTQITKLEQQIEEQEGLMVNMKRHLMSMEGLIEDLIEELYLREVESGKSSKDEVQKDAEEKAPKTKLVY